MMIPMMPMIGDIASAPRSCDGHECADDRCDGESELNHVA
jgi:hypothetical protein